MEPIMNSVPDIFQNRGRRIDKNPIRMREDKWIASLKTSIADVVQENFEIKKRPRGSQRSDRYEVDPL